MAGPVLSVAAQRKSVEPRSRRAYLGLGSNLNDPSAQLHAALARLTDWPGVRVAHCSRFYRSAAIGPLGQPPYCNAVCSVDTALAPESLLDALIAIEDSLGRVRGLERWSARVIDLDLLACDALALSTPRLTLPHPEIARRAFVLVPLAEIAPDLRLPGLGKVHELAQKVSREGLSLWA